VAQATGVETFKDCKVETSTDGSTWTDISGYASSVAVDGFERAQGEAYTFDGDYPIVGTGKMQRGTVTVRIAYTEGESDPFKAAWDAYEGNTQLQVRYWPEGGETGEFGFYTDTDSRIVAPPTVAGEANSADPIMVEFQVVSKRLQRTTAT